MRNIVYVVVLIWTCNSLIGQEYKFGKVSKEELLEQRYEKDPTASAVILYESRKIELQKETVYKRIKFYSEKGYDFATVKVLLYKEMKKERLSALNAVTYTLEEGKIIKTKLNTEDIFRSEESKYYDAVKFTMPALREGAIIEYKYTISKPYILHSTRIPLQYEIPVKKLEMSFSSPEFYNFRKNIVGYLNVNYKESKKTKTIKQNISRENNSTDYYTNPKKTYSLNTGTIQMIDIPAFKIEKYSGNYKNYMAAIVYDLAYEKFPDTPIKYYAQTWEDVTQNIYKQSNFGLELRKKKYYDKELKEVVKGKATAINKMKAIFTFVQQRMTWNERYGVGTDKGVIKAYEEKTGNIAEINLILVSMLRKAGLTAYPVVISTGDRVKSLFPTLGSFNYVIARVALKDGAEVYLDATDPYGLPNILSKRVYLGMGRVITEDGRSKEANLRASKISKQKCLASYNLDDKGNVYGRLREQHTEYYAHLFRESHALKTEEELFRYTEKKYELEELKNYKVTGIKSLDSDIVESIEFVRDDHVQKSGDELLFAPLLFLLKNENIFKSNERNYPVDFGFAFSKTYSCSISFPKGYEVVAVPKPTIVKLPDGIGEFSYTTVNKDGKIQTISKIAIKAAVFPMSYYGVLKEFYNQVAAKVQEQIVLKKI